MRIQWLGLLVIGWSCVSLGCGGGPEFKPTARRAEPEKEMTAEEVARLMAERTGQAVPDPTTEDGSTETNSSLPPTTPAAVPANAAATPVAAGPDLSTMLPPSEHATTSESLAIYKERMKKIGDAMVQEISDTGFLPNPQIMNSDGEPGLSWRVRMLPALGYKDLYNKFKLDESWDSPHNIQLLPFMPEIFRSGAQEPGKTCFQVPMGPRFAFPGDRLPSLLDVTHGIGATVILVQTNDASAVPWTAPREYRPTEANGASGLAVTEAGTHLVLWGSGDVRELRTDAGGGSYICMLTISGPKEIWSPLDVDANPPAVAEAGPDAEMEAAVAGSGNDTTTTPAVAAPSNDPLYKLEGFVSERLAKREYEHVAELTLLTQLLREEGPATLTAGWMPSTSSLRHLPRIGVAVTCPIGGRISSANPVKQTQGTESNSVYKWQGLNELTGDLGQSVVNRVMERIEAGALGAAQVSASDPARRTSTLNNQSDRFLAAGFEYLGNERVNKIMESAEYRGLDLLIHFDCELSLTRQNIVANTTTVKVYDVRTRNPIWESSSVNNLKVVQAWNDLSLENPFDKMQVELQAFLDQQVALDFNHELTIEEARALVDLESFENERPDWARALECRELLQRGLVSQVEYQQAFAAACKIDWQAYESADLAARMQLLLEKADPSIALAAQDAMSWVPEATRPNVATSEDEGS